LLRQFS
jgi:hypothetical protein